MPVNMSPATSPKEKVLYTIHVDILLTLDKIFLTKATFFSSFFFSVDFFRHSLEQLILLAYSRRHSVVRLAVLADAY